MITPQTSGGALTNASAENATIPRMLPAMSRRYASSGANRTNTRATPPAIAAITENESTNMTDSEIHFGNAGHPKAPTTRSSPSTGPPCTGNSKMNTNNAARAAGANRNRSKRSWERRNPTPTPRKLASRMKLVKKER